MRAAPGTRGTCRRTGGEASTRRQTAEWGREEEKHSSLESDGGKAVGLSCSFTSADCCVLVFLFSSGTNVLQILLLGKTGSGKSSLANTIFGGLAEFNVSHSAGSTTKVCQTKTQTVNGRKLRLIDTPGLFDTDLDNTTLSSEDLKFLIECASGVHAFLILLKVEKYTMHEKQVIESIFKQFTKEALKYTTVVFTHGDQLPDEITIESWVKDNEKVKNLVQKCGGRCHVIDNKYWNNRDPIEYPYRNNQVQIENLLNTIEKTVTQNGGKCYTTKTLKMIEKQIQDAISQNNESSPEDDAQKRRIVLLGKTGAGKSSLGNTFGQLGEKIVPDKFKTSDSPNSVTSDCEAKNININGRNVELIDTPELLNSLQKCADGVHAFLLVLKLERYTEHEQAVIEIILKVFFEEALKYTTVVITHGDDLEAGKTINDWANENEALKNLVEKCGGRCHVIDNKHWGKKQDKLTRRSECHLRIVLLGKTGAGKSSLGNTFGQLANSVTSDCESKNIKINGRNVELIDTPGLFDTDPKKSDISPELLNSLQKCADGVHAFLLVLKL
uniref:AIG1-type G domain-containing protein n=1 Tax=Neogobius melanostomus TaxID=47308 RepID=A0A8C6UBZ4_9GOBI